MTSVLSDPTDLEGLRQHLEAADPEGRLETLAMQRVVISSEAHLDVATHVAAVCRKDRANVVVLTDKTVIRRAGKKLSASILSQLARHDARQAVLDDGHATLHADDAVLDEATRAVAGADVVVTIGSGTMTDIGKVATNRNGDIPHIVVQTAASVDGFTDNVSVILRNGVKRTIPSRWPTIVLADTATIADAPRELNTSGLGEAISLFTAPADWRLANLAGLDDTFHPASMELLKAAAAEPPNWSAGLVRGDKTAVSRLTSLLALRGIVSGISRTTACLSGVEHVISHMLDLHHAAHHQPVGLHGAQVGVASLVAAKLWRRAIDEELIDARRLRLPDAEAVSRNVRSAFGHLGESIAEECWRDCQKKLQALSGNWPRVQHVVEHWRTVREEFAKMVQSPVTLGAALNASGSPATFAALKPAVSPALARWAVANCHLMRNRFNLVDLLDLMGLWTDELIDWAIADVMPHTAKGAA